MTSAGLTRLKHFGIGATAAVLIATHPLVAADRIDSYDALFTQGFEASQTQDYARAEARFRKAIEVREAQGLEDNAAYNALGWILFSQGKLAEAELQYQIGVDRAGTNPASLNRKLFTNIGVLYYSLGNLGKAEHYLDIAAKRYGSESAERLRHKIRTVVEQQMRSDQRNAQFQVDESLHRIEISLKIGEYIGQKVWYNEGAGEDRNLISWNPGEDHLSVGIAHFIWYPKDRDGPYTETFPPFLERVESAGVAMPRWLRDDRDSPWSSAEETRRAEQAQSSTYIELQAFLKQTVPHQVQYLVDRLNNALPAMAATIGDPTERARVIENFGRVAKQPDGAPNPDGVYALLDYVNFKGEGTSPTERYQGQGWGLLHVLGNMSSDAADPIEAFVRSAKEVLLRRIANAPPDKDESRWKNGWFNRLDTYVRS